MLRRPFLASIAAAPRIRPKDLFFGFSATACAAAASLASGPAAARGVPSRTTGEGEGVPASAASSHPFVEKAQSARRSMLRCCRLLASRRSGHAAAELQLQLKVELGARREAHRHAAAGVRRFVDRLRAVLEVELPFCL